jgi:hypothetical protein
MVGMRWRSSRPTGAQVARQSLERIEGRHQDQPGNGAMPGEIDRHPGADAEPDGNNAPRGGAVLQAIKDHQRIRQQCLSAGPAAAGPVAAIMEGDDVVLGKKPVEIDGHGPGIPGVAPEAQQRGPAGCISDGGNEETDELLAVGRAHLQALC